MDISNFSLTELKRIINDHVNLGHCWLIKNRKIYFYTIQG